MTEENKVAELLTTRYKVIAGYPEMKEHDISVGQILQDSKERPLITATLEKYPHLFKRLEWWEGRKPEEMPEYVKEIEDGLTHFYKNRTDFKYLSAPHLIGMKRTDDKRMIHLQYLQPATQSEYDQYIKQKI